MDSSDRSPSLAPSPVSKAHQASATEPDPAADQELLRRAGDGERRGWNQLYERFSPKFHVVAARLLFRHGPRLGVQASRPYLEDLVQSVWQHILNRRKDISRDFDPQKGPLEAYLGIIARNLILSQLRSASRRPWTDGDEPSTLPEASASEPDPESRAGDRQALSRLRSCMERELGLPEAQLLMRVLVDEEEISAIASEQRVQRNTLDQRISRARKRLRDCMQELNLKGSARRQ